MKKLRILLFISFLIVPVLGSYTKGVQAKHTVYIEKEVSTVLETLTVYNPVKRQCDRTPLITASNARINVNKLKKKEVRWMALSRNLLKRWKGEFHYGDTVMITSGDPEIDGLWVIQDNLNKRFKNRGDLLFDHTVRKHGKWQNVRVSKFETQAIEFHDTELIAFNN